MERGETAARQFARGAAAGGAGLVRTFRGNVQTLSRGRAARRRDPRFRLIPFDRWQVGNGVAVFGSALILVALVLDAVADTWRRGMPEPVEAGFELLTRLGKSDWILVGTGLFLVWALARDAAALRRRPRCAHWARAAVALYLFLSVAVAGLIAVLLKYAIGRARPELLEEFGPYSFQALAFDPDWASFPSGHATTAMALAVALGLLVRRLRAAIICAGLWIAFSRVANGAHYPSDSLAGCLLGGATAWLLARAFAQRRVVFGFDGAGALRPRLMTVRAFSRPRSRSDPSR